MNASHHLSGPNCASCQILNVEKNRLKALPESIGNLRLLQTLNLKGMSFTVT